MGFSCETSRHAVKQFARLLPNQLPLKGWHAYVGAFDQRIQQLLIASPRPPVRIGKKFMVRDAAMLSHPRRGINTQVLDLRIAVFRQHIDNAKTDPEIKSLTEKASRISGRTEPKSSIPSHFRIMKR